MRLSEPAPAKLNLALHVRGKLPDGRHALETLFAFCTDGDIVHAEPADTLSLQISGPFAEGLEVEGNLVLRAAEALRGQTADTRGAALFLDKRLPVASGIGGGSADAAATLRLLTRMWRLDPARASEVAPDLGADVPACLLSMTARGEGAGDRLALITDPLISGRPVLLVNPMHGLSTASVFGAWDGIDRGPLEKWQQGRNDLQPAAVSLEPEIREVLDWLEGREGAELVRMSGSGTTCFALFATEEQSAAAAGQCPSKWWHMASLLR
ncbi:4-(cytidine 5'-diphospho)-2-C-methyl-D-erythritol kinase [Sphingomonas xanthus]|uniref:4-diphosphocytidyl-2-C-methyl-D-erythritol kinase n=2 Tax=Sphingomonas xanthus TaxID=2594473 RepID=A0A516INT1_9SPHN|nr:4-(cytidine 5'-diphospho)-2-C-methyl-D-erythritol kinase [Sphingomonas xanthus]QDP18573.1 4-(cytidine 5'-diphospho)-2-C-methyl-D-erythritol kinase [Sphingomonas xanthus]